MSFARWMVPLGLGIGSAAALLLASSSAEGAPSEPAQAGSEWSGSGFIRRAEGLSHEAREALVMEFVWRGAMPRSLGALRPVTIAERGRRVTVWVQPDVFAVGVDGDRFRPALTARTAQRVADALGMALPTEKLVRATYAAAEAKIPMRAFGAPRDTFARHIQSDRAIAARIARARVLESTFVAGHSKDYVVGAPRSRNPDSIAIYGAWDAEGTRIQPSSGRAHSLGYRDYSQRTRLVAPEVEIDGVRRPLVEVLGDPAVASLLHDEGAVRASSLRYPT